VGSQDLLAPRDGLQLPPGLLTGAVLLLRMDVAVFVAMELVGHVLDLASRAGVQFAARLLRNIAPEGTGLVVAAATAASGSAASLALALGVGGLTAIEQAVAESGGRVWHGP